MVLRPLRSSVSHSIYFTFSKALFKSGMTTRSWILASAGSNAGTATQNIDLYVKYVRIWSCPTWQGSDGDASRMYNGSTLYNSRGLNYWH